MYGHMWASGKAFDSRSKGLGFDSHCWSFVEVSGKLFMTYCLCLPSSDGYPVPGGQEIVTEWLKLPACLYDMFAVFSQEI